MNNNVYIHSARGYDGLPNLVMLNYWTPWQSQAFPHLIGLLPVWVQPATLQAISPYVPSRAMMYGTAPQVAQPVQAPCQLLEQVNESCLSRQEISTQVYGGPEVQSNEPPVSIPHSLADIESAKEVKAEMEKKEPTKHGRKRKREGVPEMRKKKRMKSKADGRESVNRNIMDQEKVPSDSKQDHSVIAADRQSNVERSRVDPKGGTLKSHLHERIAESTRVFHCLGDKTRKPSPFQPPKDNLGADFTQRLKARSGSLMLPQNNKRCRSKEDVELGFQNRVKKRTIPGDSNLSSVSCRSSCNPSAGSVPELARERPYISTAAPCSQAKASERGEQGSSYWQSSPCLPQNGCSRIKFPFVLEESTPIQPWQREEREAMKKAAQREREQAARVTTMGIDYVNERLRYRE